MSPEASERPPDEATAETQARTPDRTLFAILGVIALLVIVALAVVFTRGEPAPLDGTTPAGVVQRYSAAVIAGDEEAAAAYLGEAARSRCSQTARTGADQLRVVLVSTTERAETADVKVLITASNGGGPFGSGEYQVEDVFDLARTGDTWKIDNAPWQLAVCPDAAAKQ